jgi:hypothetical protein
LRLFPNTDGLLVQFLLESFGHGLEDQRNQFHDSFSEANQTALNVLECVFKRAFQHREELDLVMHNRNPSEVLLEEQQEG